MAKGNSPVTYYYTLNEVCWPLGLKNLNNDIQCHKIHVRNKNPELVILKSLKQSIFKIQQPSY